VYIVLARSKNAIVRSGLCALLAAKKSPNSAVISGIAARLPLPGCVAASAGVPTAPSPAAAPRTEPRRSKVRRSMPSSGCGFVMMASGLDPSN
jgi:hypothetical protein